MAAVDSGRSLCGQDAEANSRAVKSLSYRLGADPTGICELPHYAWYANRADGAPITPYHRYTVVMLIDQGYEIWKPDVERCARYRITNPRGSACGRCMKTCPLNKEVSADGS